MTSRNVIVNGFVAQGYEDVKEQFQENFNQGHEDCAQLCVFVKGKKVVDLYGGHDGYNEASLQNVFSSTKVLTSLVVAMLVDRGYLKYNQALETIWPEYNSHGKGGTTVAQLVSCTTMNESYVIVSKSL